MKQFLYSRSRIIEALIHIIGWGIVFAFPFVMMTRSGFTITWVEYLRHGSVVPLSFLIVFYGNYCFLIPNHSYRIASIGSKSAAFLAGYQPKNTPVTVQTAKLRNTLQACM